MPARPMQFHLFLPQMRLSFDQLVERAVAAEAAGFNGIALMDHLTPPAAADQPMFEAMVTATWLAARTTTLRVGHLVLCDSFRHPAMLAREAVSIDHASGGRFELGIGWGSVPDELATFGVGSTRAGERVERLAESLDVVTALWTGAAVDHDGSHFRVAGGAQAPAPVNGRIPIVIGGAGPKTMALVRRHADWWNCPMHQLHRFDEARANAGDARVSVQQMVTFVADDADRDQVVATADRRFGWMAPDGRTTGNADELVAHFDRLGRRGVERVYAWFTDFAAPETLVAFGDGVVAPLAS